MSIPKGSFPGKFPSIKIIPNAAKSIIHFLKPKKLLGYDETTSKSLKMCASLITHPLSFNYNHSLFTAIFPDHL
jgi:hypothetical protein